MWKERLITVALLLFIAACAVVTVVKIESAYTPPDGGGPTPEVVTESPAASPAAVTPAPPSPTPRRTVTVWVTVRPRPPRPPASSAGEDGA
jgi:hypothetical protein